VCLSRGEVGNRLSDAVCPLRVCACVCVAMLRTTIIAATAACASSLTVGAGVRGAPARASMPAMSFYEFEGTTIGGEKATMADFKGKPVLVMNVASL